MVKNIIFQDGLFDDHTASLKQLKSSVNCCILHLIQHKLSSLNKVRFNKVKFIRTSITYIVIYKISKILPLYQNVHDIMKHKIIKEGL